MKAALYTVALLGVAAAFSTVPAQAQQGDSAQEKVSRVVVYGRDPCPRGTGEEIVVCARRPETERYRIPEALREPSDNPENESWAARAETIEYVGRTGIQSCSTVGPGGVSGCWDQMVRAWRDDRPRGTAPGQ
ncbi:MAG TPA: hypothetical protein VK472_00225 [Allosphingosinicella sp.]|nr:hypothetical protein [Allosphingosinicella sp.]